MSSITLPRAVAEQALEALETSLVVLDSMRADESWRKQHIASAAALRAALEQPGSEKPRTGCEAKRKNGGVCPYHNLHCGWPACEGKQ